MTTITLNENLDKQIHSLALQAMTSADEIVNGVLAKYLNDYLQESIEDLELLAIVKQRENEPCIKVSIDEL